MAEKVETQKEKVKKPKTQATTKAKAKTEKKKPAEKEVKKPVKLKKEVKKPTKIDPRTGKAVTSSKPKPVEKKETPEVVVEAEQPKKRKRLPKKSSKELTVEPGPKQPVVIVRPTPKKTKELNKEEKALYKQLEEAFSFIANMTTVIEERTLDRKSVDDLTIGELHVIETVNRNNNKPMSLIAKKEHITVGALTTCVNRLVQKGYLLRYRDEMDHRVILLSVTPLAKKVLKAHDKFHSDIIGLALENVNLAQATKVMNMFAEMLEYYYDPIGFEAKAEKAKAKVNKKK